MLELDGRTSFTAGVYTVLLVDSWSGPEFTVDFVVGTFDVIKWRQTAWEGRHHRFVQDKKVFRFDCYHDGAESVFASIDLVKWQELVDALRSFPILNVHAF